MAFHESIRGLRRPGTRRPPLVGLDFLHEGARARRMAMSRSSFQARDLFSLLLRHFARKGEAEPHIRITLNAPSPSGRQLVRILGRKRAAATVAEAPARIQKLG